MAKQDNSDDVNFETATPQDVQTMRNIATIQRLGMQKLQMQGIKASHLLSILNMATGAQTSLKGGLASKSRRVWPPSEEGESWKGEASAAKYDGGADAALDGLISGVAMRLLKIVEDDSEWTHAPEDALEQQLVSWAKWENERAAHEAAAMKTQRRPCVLHTIDVFNGPRGFWYCVNVPFSVDNGKCPVIGVGRTPVDACYDYDRVFLGGEMLPTAALWLEEQREQLDQQKGKRHGREKVDSTRSRRPRKTKRPG